MAKYFQLQNISWFPLFRRCLE